MLELMHHVLIQRLVHYFIILPVSRFIAHDLHQRLLQELREKSAILTHISPVIVAGGIVSNLAVVRKLQG